MPFIETLGQQMVGQAGSGIVGEAMGLLFAGPKRKAQLKTAKKMQELQIKGSKELTDYNAAKQLEMWKNTNYGPQMEELKKAGLNPGLLYGMGGAGGATTNVATGSVSGQAAHEPEAPGMGITPLTSAQIKLMEAQARNLNVDSEKKEGVDTEEAKTRIQTLIQQQKTGAAQEALTKVQTEMGKIGVAEANMSQQDRMKQISVATDRAITELEIARNNATISSATVQEAINLIREEAIGAALKNALTDAQTANVKESTRIAGEDLILRINQLTIDWAKLDIDERKQDVAELEYMLKEKYPTMDQLKVRSLVEALEAIGVRLGVAEEKFRKAKRSEERRTPTSYEKRQ